ncbi:acyl-CoA dehydrogenase family protein [Pseudonocardia endophytica]|uniref:Cyclohexanecarboxyl-CoA dehydrogenase n=1 Tax=Pseudonocardia endophytica TaxID=401976 RepID=A0A4R1I1T8_PSEEN|nr:acyl-CoA dehydrogenase family protein [Pseudonocardia endophytica]TCK27545.1 cyclohexanecarboxyl-CoA dehydrogenase [Pseudonocardia endophytica]
MGTPFVLDADHRVFRDTVRDLARSEFLPGYLGRAARDEFPHQEVKRLAAAGLLDLTLAEERGGQGADLIALGLACEEVGYADPNLGYVLFATNLVVPLLAAHPGSAVRGWATRVAAGDALACFAVTEPGGGSDAAAQRTRAERVDGGWRLTGEKTSVTQAPHADVAIVLAQTDAGSRARGIGCFLVETADPTVSSQRFADPGFRPLGRGSVTMDGTFVPDERVLAEPGGGFQQIMAEFDLSRTLIALTCAGAAQRALDLASSYASERVAFGRPLAANQGVSFPIAEHTTYLEAVRALAFHTLGLRMAGEPHTTQAAMLKWWAPRVAFAAVQEAVVLHGHVGWSEEMPLQALLRDVSGYQIGDGTPQIQKIIIARDVLGRVAVDH